MSHSPHNLRFIALAFFILMAFSRCATRPHSVTKPEPVTVLKSFEGVASWYGRELNGRRTASGERFNMKALTAAHKTLPFGTRLRVTDLATQKSVVVRVNDRGPFVRGRVLDLSYQAAKEIGLLARGHDRVKIEVLK